MRSFLKIFTFRLLLAAALLSDVSARVFWRDHRDGRFLEAGTYITALKKSYHLSSGDDPSEISWREDSRMLKKAKQSKNKRDKKSAKTPAPTVSPAPTGTPAPTCPPTRFVGSTSKKAKKTGSTKSCKTVQPTVMKTVQPTVMPTCPPTVAPTLAPETTKSKGSKKRKSTKKAPSFSCKSGS
jgi:hypothetical protein